DLTSAALRRIATADVVERPLLRLMREPARDLILAARLPRQPDRHVRNASRVVCRAVEIRLIEVPNGTLVVEGVNDTRVERFVSVGRIEPETILANRPADTGVEIGDVIDLRYTRDPTITQPLGQIARRPWHACHIAVHRAPQAVPAVLGHEIGIDA